MLILIFGAIFSLIVYFYLLYINTLNYTVVDIGERCNGNELICGSDATCSAGVCLGIEGATCNSNSHCLSGTCAGSLVCKETPDDGSFLNAPGPFGCEEGLILDSSGTVCLQDAGANCSLDRACASNLCLSGGTCSEIPRGGEACNGYCMSGFECDLGVCQPEGVSRGSDGYYCKDSSFCHCVQGICETRGTEEIGQVCVENSDCYLNNCDSGVCKFPGYTSGYCPKNYTLVSGVCLPNKDQACISSCNNSQCSESSSIVQIGVGVTYSFVSSDYTDFNVNDRISVISNGSMYYINTDWTKIALTSGIYTDTGIIGITGNSEIAGNSLFYKNTLYRLVDSLGNNISLGTETKVSSSGTIVSFNTASYDIYRLTSANGNYSFTKNTVAASITKLLSIYEFGNSLGVLYYNTGQYNLNVHQLNQDLSYNLTSKTFAHPEIDPKVEVSGFYVRYKNRDRTAFLHQKVGNNYKTLYIEDIEYPGQFGKNALVSIRDTTGEVYVLTDKVCI